MFVIGTFPAPARCYLMHHSTITRVTSRQRRFWHSPCRQPSPLLVSLRQTYQQPFQFRQQRGVQALANAPSSTLSASSVSPSAEELPLLQSWKTHPALNPILTFPTWIVPKEACHTVISSPILGPYLGSRGLPILENLTMRTKLVRSLNDTHQLVLRNALQSPSQQQQQQLPQDVMDLLDELQIANGPSCEIPISYSQLTVPYILNTLLPSSAQPAPTAFEQIGHVAHFNLRPCHVPYQHFIGQVVCEILPTIETVVNKVGEVHGDYRVYDMQLLAGRDDTNVKVVEHGITLQFNLAKVYWSCRLAGERKYLVQNVVRPKQVIADAFCGVGALCLMAASRHDHTRILANDWNPNAIQALQQNAKHNRVSHRIQTSCGDSYEFLVSLGLPPTTTSSTTTSTMSDYQLPHHVFMNYPLEAPQFLSALRWWKAPKRKTDVIPKVHVYTFAKDDVVTHRTAAQVAVDDIAHHLLPEGNDVTFGRMDHLNQLGCQVVAREIRNVSPGKIVFCVTFQVTAQLLRHMQGDFV